MRRSRARRRKAGARVCREAAVMTLRPGCARQPVRPGLRSSGAGLKAPLPRVHHLPRLHVGTALAARGSPREFPGERKAPSAPCEHTEGHLHVGPAGVCRVLHAASVLHDEPAARRRAARTVRPHRHSTAVGRRPVDRACRERAASVGVPAPGACQADCRPRRGTFRRLSDAQLALSYAAARPHL